MKVPFVDLNAQHNEISSEIDNTFKRVIASSAFIDGEEVTRFEQEFADYIKIDHCVSVNSGTDALILGIRALNFDLSDEIIVPANTFIATALGISENGLKPVFVDCDNTDYGIDLIDLKRKITSRTRAIIAVHLYGQPDKLDEINSIIKKSGKNIHLIEDAAQAHGALYKNKPVGSFGTFAIFSFYPAKNLGALGDGGAIVTNNKKLATQFRLLREYGQIKKYYHLQSGRNSRLDSIQAAMLRVKLKHLDDWNKDRQQHAAQYNQKLSSLTPVVLPSDYKMRKSIYHLYVIKAPNRDKLMKYLLKKNITTLIHYPIPLHLQKAYSHLGYKRGDFPNAEKISRLILSLPMYPQLSQEQIDYTASSIKEFYETK